MELGLSGARAEVAVYAARLVLDGSVRALAHSRLRVTDATGQELRARLEVLSADRLAVCGGATTADVTGTFIEASRNPCDFPCRRITCRH